MRRGSRACRRVDAGADDYLRKPFREYELFDVLASNVGVKYAYESGPDMTTKNFDWRGDESIAFSPSFIETICEAAGRLDLDRVIELIDDAAVTAPVFAERLRELATGFQFDALTSLLRREG